MTYPAIVSLVDEFARTLEALEIANASLSAFARTFKNMAASTHNPAVMMMITPVTVTPPPFSLAIIHTAKRLTEISDNLGIDLKTVQDMWGEEMHNRNTPVLCRFRRALGGAYINESYDL